MSEELIVVESPNKCESWFKYSGIKTIATKGHFLGLPKKNMGIDLETYVHKFIVENDYVYKNLKREAKGKIVYLAADEDREGKAIAYMTYLTIKDVAKEIYIIGTNEITPKGIKQALENKLRFELFDKNYYKAFLGRRLSDRIIGYLLSPMANKSLNAGVDKKDYIAYSAGRVQTVGLKLVYDREMEIRAFMEKAKNDPESIKFYSLSAFVDIEGKTVELKHENSKFKDIDNVKSLINKLQSYPAVIKSILKRNGTSKVITPYDTSDLQQDASSKLGFDVKKTMDIAQKLFEAGLITYHRTDMTVLSDDFNDKLRDYIAKKYSAEKLPSSKIVHKNKKKNAQEGHEGVRPTDLNLDSSGLSANEKALYDLIKARTVASQMASPVFKVTTVEFNINGEKFEIKTKLCESTGYLDVYKLAIKKDEVILPNLSEGDEFIVDRLEAISHQQTPPKRYTQASLVKKLESDDIGRPSTYATIISTILGRGYVKELGDKKVKTLMLTNTGETLINWAKGEELAEWLLDYKFTAYLEGELDKVQNGVRDYKDLLKEIHEKMGFKKFEEKKKNFIDKTCYCCGGKMIDVGHAFCCENYSYDRTKNISTGCQMLLFKEPIGLTVENLDDLLAGKVFENVNTQHGFVDYVIDKKALEHCKSGKKLKAGQSLIIKKKDFCEGMTCPKCGGAIAKTDNQYSCENVRLTKVSGKFKNVGTCDFKVNKKNDFVGYELDDDIFKQLLDYGKLELTNGKTIMIDLENDYFIVDEAYKKRQENIKLTGEKCPICGDETIENGKVFTCQKKKKKSCKFVVFKENSKFNYVLDVSKYKRLIAGEFLDIGNGKTLSLDLSNKFYTKIA